MTSYPPTHILESHKTVAVRDGKALLVPICTQRIGQTHEILMMMMMMMMMILTSIVSLYTRMDGDPEGFRKS